jgi:hypothetical protein
MWDRTRSRPGPSTHIQVEEIGIPDSKAICIPAITRPISLANDTFPNPLCAHTSWTVITTTTTIRATIT